MLPLLVLAVSALLALVVSRIAASPPFLLLSCLFGSWADRCRNNGELDRSGALARKP